MKMYIEKAPEFYKQVSHIILPVALQQAVNIGVNMMDTVMLGAFGEVQLSASSLANSFYTLFVILCMGTIGGCSVLAAQYWGAGNKERVRETFSLALRLAIGLSAIFAIVTALFPGQIMRIYSKEAAVIAAGRKYLKITAYTYAFHGTGMVIASLMRSVQNARLGLYVSLSSFFVNLFANWVFIFGKFGAPRMEIAGAAVGTLIARIVEFSITFFYVLCIDKKLNLRIRDLIARPSRELYHNYIRLGAAVLFSDGILGLGTNVLNMILGHMGSAIVAGNAICQVMDRLFHVVISGVGNASSVITGNTIGRGDRETALRQGQTFYLMGILLGIVSAALFLAFGVPFIHIYNLEAETISIAKQMMVVYAVLSIFEAIQMIMTKGVLRGGGDTKFLLVADVLFLWIVSLPLGFLSGLVLEAPAWLTIVCLRIDWIIKTIWCYFRLNSGKWIRETERIE